MKMFFTINSWQIQVGQEDTAIYKESIKCGAIFKADQYNNELYLSKISETLLELLINEHISENNEDNLEYDFNPLEGGLRIEFDDKVIENQCCGDISNYEKWEKLIEDESNEWNEIWIGHPWIYYKLEGNKIHLSEYYENDKKPIDIISKFIFDKNDFFKHLKECLREFYVFVEKVENVIHRGNYKNKTQLIKSLLFE